MYWLLFFAYNNSCADDEQVKSNRTFCQMWPLYQETKHSCNISPPTGNCVKDFQYSLPSLKKKQNKKTRICCSYRNTLYRVYDVRKHFVSDDKPIFKNITRPLSRDTQITITFFCNIPNYLFRKRALQKSYHVICERLILNTCGFNDTCVMHRYFKYDRFV